MHVARTFQTRISPVFIRILRSFLLLILVPVIAFTLYTYNVSITEQKRDTEAKASEQLLLAREHLDSRLTECTGIAISIYQNPLLSQDRLRDKYYVYEGVKLLSNLAGTNQFITGIDICFKGSDTLYGASGLTSLYAKLRFALQFSDLQISAFAQLMDETAAPTLTLGIPTNTLLYIIPMPYWGASISQRVLISIPATSIQGLFTAYHDAQSGTCFLLDGALEPLYADGAQQNDPALLAFRRQLADATAPAMNVFHQVDTEAGETLVMWTYSAQNDLYLMTGIPTSQAYTVSLSRQRSLTILAVAVSALCIALAFGLSARNYRPIRALSHLAAGTGLQPAMRVDDFERIRHAIDQAGLLSRRLGESKALLIENLLLRLITGGIRSEQEIRSLAEACGMALNAPSHTVLVVSLAQAGEPHAALETLHALVWDVYAPSGAAYATLSSSDATLVLLTGLCGEPLEALTTALADMADMPLHEGIGSHTDQLARLDRTFLEAHAACQSLPAGQAGVTTFDALEQQTGNGLIAWADEARLAHSLKLGDSELTQEIITGLLSLEAPHSPSPMVLRFIMYKIVDQMLHVLNELNQSMPANPALPDIAEALSQALSIYDPGEFISVVQAPAAQLCACVKQSQQQQEDATGSRVMAYMREHYADATLSLDSIASAFGYTTYYWSRYCKEKLGGNFLDLLWNIRLSHARALLQGTDLPVKDVAQQVGYLDPTNFIRRFKAVEGLTPGQYRKLWR